MLLVLYGMLASCANIAAPTGGEKDTQPPLLKATSVQDSQLHFKGGPMVFEFDEFIQLHDIRNEFVISPLLKTFPKITAHKRRVILELPDSLLTPNTTYQVSFGKGIQDIHEGNAAQNMSFTFSTGGYFDSLRLSGKVLVAASGLADTTAQVLLYPEENADSNLLKQPPPYRQKVQGGTFEIKNLPNRRFKIYAVRDANQNAYFDAGEWMAFSPNAIQPASAPSPITLYLFQDFLNRGNTQDKDKQNSRLGNAPKTTSNKPATTLTFRVNIDTLQKGKRSFDLKDSIHLVFDKKIMQWDMTKIKLYQDSILDATVKFIPDSQHAALAVDWQQDQLYTLELLPGLATDSNKLTSAGMRYTFRTKRDADYGRLTVRQQINPKAILSLYREVNKVGSFVQSDTVVSFTQLLPGEYRIEILIDENSNNQWDGGNFLKQQQPEVVERWPQSITIKANWENKIDLTQPKK